MADYNLGTARGTIEIGYKGNGPKRAKEDLEGVRRTAGGTDEALNKVSRGAGVAGAILAGGLAVAGRAAMNFEKRLSGISAVSGASEKEMDALRNKALQLGKDTAFSADESAQAMEELIKAGLTVEQVLNGAADATVNLAAAGGVDMPQAATIASNAMNQFGLTAKQMPGVVDSIAGAANASAIDVGEFGQSLQQVGAVANLAGLSFEDTAVAIAEMGNAGIKGSDAGTSLKSMLSRLQPTTKAAKEAMAELGLVAEDGSSKFYDQQGNLKKLSDIQGLLKNSLKGLTKEQQQAALQTIFGADAIRAAAVLADNGSEGYDKLAASMGKVTAADVAKERMDNLAGSIEELKGSAETLGIALGTIIIPALERIVGALTSAVNWFLNLSDGQQKALVTATAIAAGLLLTVAALIKIAQFVRAARAAFVTLRIAMMFGAIWSSLVAGFAALMAGMTGATTGATILSRAMNILGKVLRLVGLAFKALGRAMFMNPIGLIIVAIIALVAAFVILYKKNEAFRSLVQRVWGAIKGAIGAVVNWLTGTALPAIQAVWNGIVSGVKAIVGGIASAWNAVMGVIKGVFGVIAAIIRVYVGIWKAVIMGALNAIKAIWSAVWGTFGPLVKAIFALIVETIKLGLVLLAAPFILAFVALRALWNLFWTGLVAVVKFVWGLIVTTVTFYINLIKTVITAVFNVIKAIVVSIWNGIRSATAAVWNAIKAALSGPINAMLGIARRVAGAIRSAISSAWNAVKSATSSAWGALKGIVQRAVNGVKAVVDGIKDKVLAPLKRAGDWLKDAGKNIIDGLVSGIKNATHLVTGAIKSVKDKVVNGLKGALKINSPSKVIADEVGVGIPEGLAKGIDDSTIVALRAAAKLADAIPGEMSVSPLVDSTVRASVSVPTVDLNTAATQALLEGYADANKQKGSQQIMGVLDLTDRSTATIKGVAAEVDESNANFETTLARMGDKVDNA